MSAMASQITGVTIVYSTVCSSADQRKRQSSASLAFVRGVHMWPYYVHLKFLVSQVSKKSKKSVLKSVVVLAAKVLTHWGRVTHICVGKLTIIGSDNGLAPGRIPQPPPKLVTNLMNPLRTRYMPSQFWWSFLPYRGETCPDITTTSRGLCLQHYH